MTKISNRIIALAFVHILLMGSSSFSQEGSSPETHAVGPKKRGVESGVLSPCDNFWKWACETQGEKGAVDQSLKSASESVQKTYDQETEERKLWSNFQAMIPRNGDPLFNFDEATTLKNYDRFYREQGAEKLFEHVFLHGGVNPLWVAHGGPFNKLYAPFLLNYDEGTTRGGRQAMINWEKKYEGPGFASEGVEVLPGKPILPFQELLKKNYKKLPPDGFYQMVRELIQATFVSQKEDIQEYLEVGQFVQAPVRAALFPKSRTDEIEALYSEIKKIGVEELPVGALTPALKSSLEGVPLSYLPSQIQEGFLSGVPWFRELATSNNAAYQPRAKKIVILGGHAFEPDADLLSTLAHEFSHAIDAHVSQGVHAAWIKKIKDCLQSSSGPQVLPNQVDEAFADWNAARILAKYLETKKPELTLQQKQKAALGVVISCEPYTQLSTADEHPPWDKRVNEIYFANPYFRNLFGCPEDSRVKHCDASVL